MENIWPLFTTRNSVFSIRSFWKCHVYERVFPSLSVFHFYMFKQFFRKICVCMFRWHGNNLETLVLPLSFGGSVSFTKNEFAYKGSLLYRQYTYNDLIIIQSFRIQEALQCSCFPLAPVHTSWSMTSHFHYEMYTNIGCARVHFYLFMRMRALCNSHLHCVW